MHKVDIGSRIITTNFGETSADRLIQYNCKDGFYIEFKKCGVTDKEFFDNLVDLGYSYIKFAHIATSIRGFHDRVAICKGKDLDKE